MCEVEVEDLANITIQHHFLQKDTLNNATFTSGYYIPPNKKIILVWHWPWPWRWLWLWLVFLYFLFWGGLAAGTSGDSRRISKK